MIRTCPVCQSQKFRDYNGREDAVCTTCGAMERGRLAWMVLTKLDAMRPGIRLLNLAPEPFMLTKAALVLGDGYSAADFNPDYFAKWGRPISRLDLCRDAAALPAQAFDVIMHNHVLEHVPCDVVAVVRNLNAAIAPGGLHILSVPIRPKARTTENLDPNLAPEERKRLFGQEDHMRYFGELDFLDLLGQAGMTEGFVDLKRIITSDELGDAGVPIATLDSLNSHRVLAWRKPAA